MDTNLEKHIQNALVKFTSKEYYEDLVKAKEEYFTEAGQVFEEDDDYENRMSSFNLWYLLQRLPGNSTATLMSKYIEEEEVEEEVKESLLNVNHSLFEYTGQSFTKKHVLRDILHDKKIVLEKNYIMPSIVKNDIFMGRTIDFNSKSYLLEGITTVPVDVRSVLIKESKKVRKLQDNKRDLQFLMKVEAFKTKWRRYGHIDAKKIFQFK